MATDCNTKVLLTCLPKAVGVSRMADSAHTALVSFYQPLTDNQLRQLHDVLAGKQSSVIHDTRPATPWTAADVHSAADALVHLAAIAGVVITIDQVSQQPLAMGHYTTRVAVRAAKGS